MNSDTNTIAAVATGEGGAISVLRISGPDALTICDRVFRNPKGKKLADAKGYTLLYGTLLDGENTIDEVLVSVFRAPHSYTGENMAEIGCHGSPYIRQAVLDLLTRHGVRPAGAGEFTLRAFLNGKLDLSQAEAVADLIAADNRGAHALAVHQMRGGYSEEFRKLRDQLLELLSLLELELDFGEEDVEFADRLKLAEIIERTTARIDALRKSFALGNVIKNGVPVTIAGAPNVGKSTLLNALLREDRAMVSDVAGTTRDVIEGVLNIRGIRFRFIDTAGIRKTEDRLEAMGIERTFQRIGSASVVLLLVESEMPDEAVSEQIRQLGIRPGQHLAVVLNKTDRTSPDFAKKRIEELKALTEVPVLAISARENRNLDRLTDYLFQTVGEQTGEKGDIVVSNARHVEALDRAGEALKRAREGLAPGLSGDLLAEEVREAVHHLGLVTGEISTEDVLGSIFSRFCIGK